MLCCHLLSEGRHSRQKLSSLMLFTDPHRSVPTDSRCGASINVSGSSWNGKSEQQLKIARQSHSPSTTPCKKKNHQSDFNSPSSSLIERLCYLLAPLHNNSSNTGWHSRGHLGPCTYNRQNCTDNWYRYWCRIWSTLHPCWSLPTV